MHLSDLRATSRLAVDATIEVTCLVEAVHRAVLDVPCLRATPVMGAVRGLTGVVYASIRGFTKTAGSAADALLGALAPPAAEVPSTGARDAVVAALNGMIGDYLAESDNPLTLPMCVRHAGVSLEATAESLRGIAPGLGPRLMVLVHGLCMGPAQWSRGGQDRAAELARALGFTPLHVQYNSGLHISTNGRALAERLDALVRAWPVPVEEIAFVGHSMGGLVVRSALHYGASAGHRWRTVRLVAVFLGTPHHGAPLERHGHGVDRLLRLSGFTAPFVRLGRLRSAGITDLRHGNVLDDDWDGHHRFQHGHDTRCPLPLPRDVRCFAVAGCLADHGSDDSTRLPGDGLVPVASALGHHEDPRWALSFAGSHCWIATRTGHLDLARNPSVFLRLREWLQSPASGRAESVLQ